VNEFTLIEQAFRRRAPFVHRLTRLGNGDDASVHAVPEGHELVVSTDISMQGVHWPDDFPLRDAARRAVNAALSDMAAMGAAPAWTWLGVMAKSSGDAQRMGQGVAMVLRQQKIELAGGDTVHAPVNALSLAVAGLLPRGSGMRRNAAHAGEDVWLHGSAGLAAYGLRQWQAGERTGRYIPAFRDVCPLLEAGVQLREMGVACCIDVSDGLLADARHLSEASGVALHLRLQDVPGFSELKAAMNEEKAMHLVLGGGEDYALLFTASPRMRESLGGMARRIGECRQGKGVYVTLCGEKAHCVQAGYDHFG